MASVKQYVQAMRQAQNKIALKLGSDVSSAPKSLRVLCASMFCVLAVIVKVLVDKGVVTDAELQSAFNTAANDLYDDEPVHVGI